jgi:glycosyltransferase involved in cell wall biosynthesis
MRRISVITPCYNEEHNVEELYRRVRAAIQAAGSYQYEHIFIDNHSEDSTVAVLRQMAACDRRVKIIVNARNFGHIRSPHHALLQTSGDAVIGLVADLQDPPELITQMLHKWEQGYAVVLGVKEASQESALMFALRTFYYQMVKRLSAIRTIEHFTGFGLYDRKVVDIVRSFPDAYPYFRGMIAEIGLPHCEIRFQQPQRKRGVTKNNFFTLYDMAMLGITNLSKVPLRMVTLLGFATALLSVITAMIYLIYKLAYWDHFTAGMAPLVIGLFFLGSVQLLALGIVGEYIGAIHTQVLRRPLVIEQERINFEFGWAEADAEKIAS